jgi:peptidoglycan/LPS O-acetylase OafA/YrhL
MDSKRLELIDFLKGYSIFTIVLYHLLQHFNINILLEKGISFGGSGVHVFVLCSGFGLYLSHLNKPLKYVDFLKRRFLKVYIPFIIIILISAIIPFMYTENDKFMSVLSNVFLFKMFNEDFMDDFGGHLWFVSMILEFYLVFPLLTMAIKKGKAVSHIIIALIISIGWATLVGVTGKTGTRIWDSFFLQFLWEFVLGMEIAKWYKSNPEAMKLPKKNILFLICIVGIGIMGITGLKGGIFKLYNDIPTLFGYLSLSLLIYSFDIKWLNHFFIYTNSFSYEWYLTHILVFTVIFQYLGGLMPFWILTIIALIISYGLAIGYHKLLKPLIK